MGLFYSCGPDFSCRMIPKVIWDTVHEKRSKRGGSGSWNRRKKQERAHEWRLRFSHTKASIEAQLKVYRLVVYPWRADGSVYSASHMAAGLRLCPGCPKGEGARQGSGTARFSMDATGGGGRGGSRGRRRSNCADTPLKRTKQDHTTQHTSPRHARNSCRLSIRRDPG